MRLVLGAVLARLILLRLVLMLGYALLAWNQLVLYQWVLAHRVINTKAVAAVAQEVLVIKTPFQLPLEQAILLLLVWQELEPIMVEIVILSTRLQ